MPFRIRIGNRCATTSRYAPMLNLTTCVNYKQKDSYMETYIEEQLFHFYPLIRSPQKIYQYTKLPNHKKLCLTATVNPFQPLENSKDIFYLNMQSCDLTVSTDYFSSQKFSIIRINMTRIDQNEYNDKSKFNWKPITAVYIKWTHPDSREQYCMSFLEYDNNFRDTFTNRQNYMKSANLLVMKKCIKKLKKSKDRRNQQYFVLERTKTTTEIGPYLSGITLGKFPGPPYTYYKDPW